MPDLSIAACTKSEGHDDKDMLVANDRTSFVDEHVDSIVGLGTGNLVRSKAVPTVLATSCDGAVVADKNAGRPRDGSSATDLAVSSDTRDDIYRSRVRSLNGFFCWAQPFIDDIGGGTARWTSSTAFSGIGCPELANPSTDVPQEA